MPPDKEPICDDVRLELKSDIKEIFSKINTLLARLHEVDTKVAVLINREEYYPCKDHEERIERLEKTKASLYGGWKVLGIIGGIILGLCGISGMVITLVTLLK